MSIRLMSLVWDIHWPTQSHLLVALKLADHAHNDGSSIYPAKASVARQAQCSESTVSNALRALRNCGILHVVQEGGSGPRSPTIYRFNVELLEALAGIKAELEGGADSIEISEELYQQALENKGSTVAPLEGLRGQSDPSKGSTERSKGSTALTPNHHLRTTNKEPPGVQGSNFDFEVKRPLATFPVTKGNVQWAAWVKWLIEKGRNDLAEQMEAQSEVVVFGGRWPSADSPLPKIPKTALTEKSKRMSGDAA